MLAGSDELDELVELVVLDDEELLLVLLELLVDELDIRDEEGSTLFSSSFFEVLFTMAMNPRALMRVTANDRFLSRLFGFFFMKIHRHIRPKIRKMGEKMKMNSEAMK